MATIAADPLIAEARRRARRRRLALGALAIAVVAAAGYVGASGRGPGGAATGGGAPRPLNELKLIRAAAARATIVDSGLGAPGLGWAMNGLGLWLTSDGGVHWRTVTPRVPGGDVVARIRGVQFVDAQHGWASGADLIGRVYHKDGSNRFAMIERTVDGGRTWQTTAHDCAACGGSLDFLDLRRGFALSRKGLFRTGDGGVTWRFIGHAPFVGTIEFADARHGWGTTSGGRIYRTSDGGRRWRRVTFGVHATASAPRLFGPRVAVTAVRVGQRAFVAVTHDGGRSWTRRTSPAAIDLRGVQRGYASALPFSAATPRAYALYAARTLWRTSDAGMTWSRIRPRVAPAHVWNLQFTSRQDGWAIFAVRTGVALVHTVNGGRDWLPLTPPVPKSP